jgi:hypothetical protein
MLEKPEGANQEWTVERHWQYCVYKTQDEKKQKNTTLETKNMSNTNSTKSRV